jgi:hypothetical protein
MKRLLTVLIYDEGDSPSIFTVADCDLCIRKSLAGEYTCSKHRYHNPKDLSSKDLKKLVVLLGVS